MVEDQAIVQTTSGKVKGQQRETVYGDTFYCFDGIPYAQPPVGNLRFKDAQPIERWEGIRDCTQIPNKSVQWNRYEQQVQGSEDCLYLNVYVKKFNTHPRLPVMVYLHGGGHNTGDATRLSWGPDYFMMKDVVFVTIGYRLGLLGLARFKDKSLGIPGNAGLRDVILALKWLHDNCENFNGDKENITLFGHSSGSWATHLLMLSPAAKGLFHKAILMAGFAMETPPLPDLHFRLAKHLGYQGADNDEQAIYKFLCSVEAQKLVGFDIWTDEERQKYGSYPFMPSLEAYSNENTILAEEPVILQRNTWSNTIPLMLGCTSNESLIKYKYFTTDESLYERYRKYPENLLPQKLQDLNDNKLKQKFIQKILDLHFGNKEVKMENYECAMENDSYAWYHQLHRVIQSRLRNSPAPTYVYRFDFDSPFFNLYRLKHCGPNVRGAGHVDELSYIFFMPGSFKLDKSTPEYKCIEQMIESFYCFAKSSNPTNAKIQPAYWEPVSRRGIPKVLNISYDSTTFISQPEYQNCCARDEMYNEAGILLY